jgi:hypothetical protein
MNMTPLNLLELYGSLGIHVKNAATFFSQITISPQWKIL